jgi:hypothetical protein
MQRRFNLVVDFAYGATIAVLPDLLGALRADIVSLNAYAAPGRLSRTEAEFHEALDRLGGIVRSIRAELGHLDRSWRRGRAPGGRRGAAAGGRSGRSSSSRTWRCSTWACAGWRSR